jgi:hypothetical protein
LLRGAVPARAIAEQLGPILRLLLEQCAVPPRVAGRGVALHHCGRLVGGGDVPVRAVRDRYVAVFECDVLGERQRFLQEVAAKLVVTDALEYE